MLIPFFVSQGTDRTDQIEFLKQLRVISDNAKLGKILFPRTVVSYIFRLSQSYSQATYPALGWLVVAFVILQVLAWQWRFFSTLFHPSSTTIQMWLHVWKLKCGRSKFNLSSLSLHQTTVEPVLSSHPWGFAKWLLNRGCALYMSNTKSL